MKKLVYLILASGLVCIGLLTGCQKQAEEPSMGSSMTNAPAMPSTNAPEMPSTNQAAQ